MVTGELYFPFRLEHVFFKSLEFYREPEVPDELNVRLSTQLKVVDKEFPKRLETHLKLETQAEEPLTFCLELVGVFALVEGAAEPSRDILPEFVNERALHILWPYLTQMVDHITGQMGTNPLKIPTPYTFAFEPSE